MIYKIKTSVNRAVVGKLATSDLKVKEVRGPFAWAVGLNVVHVQKELEWRYKLTTELESANTNL